MLSYIFESGEALERSLRQAEIPLNEVAAEAKRRGYERLVLTGVGSSYTAASAAKPAFDLLVEVPTYVVPATDLATYRSLLGPRTVVVVLSRSGERKFVIDALALAQQTGALTIALTAAPESLMAQRASSVVVTAEGPERSFAKTKSVTTGVGVLVQLALALSTDTNQVSTLRRDLDQVPVHIDQTLAMVKDQVERLASSLLAFDRVIVAGTGGNAGAAMEMQIKLQECALVTCQWMDTGNLFHGPLCLLDQRWLVILLVAKDDLELSSETFALVRAMKGNTLGLIPTELQSANQPDYSIRLPKSLPRLLEPLSYLPVLQLLVFHWALSKGLNPDSPPGEDILLNAFLPAGRSETDQIART